MNRAELERLAIETEHGVFYPIYECETIENEVEKEVDGEVIIETVIDFEYTVTLSAEENYQQWLIVQENPPEIEPTKTEILQQKVTQLESDNLTLNEQSLDLDFRLVMLEMGI